MTQQKIQAEQITLNGQDLPEATGTQGQVLTVGSPVTTTIWADQTGGGGGAVNISGTPANNQLAVWTNSDTIEGDSGLTWDGSNLAATNFGGIAQANLLDKTANEVITGDWTFNISSIGDVIINRTNSTSASGILFRNDDGAKGYIGFDDAGTYNIWNSGATSVLTVDNAGNLDADGDVDGASIAGITSGNLLDKTAAETISGVFTFSTRPTISSSSGILFSAVGEGLEIENGGDRTGNPTKGGHTPNDTRHINIRDGNPPADGALLITSDSAAAGDALNEILYISTSIFEFNGNDVLTTASSIAPTQIASGNLGSGVLPYAGVSGTSGSFRIPFLNTQANSAGNFGLFHDTNGALFYNPSTNTLTSATFAGNLSGNATSATTATTATNATQLGGVAAANYARNDTTLTMASGADIQWSDASQPWLNLNSTSSGDNWTAQGAGISVGESGKKGQAAIHMTYNGDGSGYVGMGTVTDTAGTGGRPGSGHIEFTYNNFNVQVGGRLFPGNNSTTTQATKYIDNPTTYGSINVAGTTTAYAGYSINNDIIFMSNGSTHGLFNAGSSEWIIQNTDNSAVTLFFNNSTRLATAAGGVNITGDLDVQGGSVTVDQDEIINAGNLLDIFSTNNDAVIRMTGTSTGNDLFIQVDNGSDAVVCRTNAEVELHHNGVLQLETQDNDATGVTSGARVKSHDGALKDVGFNSLDVEVEDVNATLSAVLAGGVYFKDGTTSRTLTLEASGSTDFGIGKTCQVINAATTGNITVTEGSGTTLYYLDGTTRTDTAGGCTVGPGGVATLWRENTTIYYIWGAGITP